MTRCAICNTARHITLVAIEGDVAIVQDNCGCGYTTCRYTAGSVII